MEEDIDWVDKIWRKGEVAEPNWVVHKLAAEPGQLNYMIFCPACKCGHGFRAGDDGHPGPIWGFNSDMVKPTLYPAGVGHTCSVLVNYYNYKYKKNMICHFHITHGVIQYCPDSTHEFAGKSLLLEPF